jgi:hypothetical protein
MYYDRICFVIYVTNSKHRLCHSTKAILRASPETRPCNAVMQSNYKKKAVDNTNILMLQCEQSGGYLVYRSVAPNNYHKLDGSAAP